MRNYATPLLAALLAAAATAGVATAGTHLTGDDHHRDGRDSSYSIGLWGDLPYSDVQKTVGVPNLIADMNSQPLAFTANDDDIKSGSSPCTDDVYTSFKATMNSLRAPAAFTPGDNDWTDCDRDGVHTSGERLDFERKLFFSTPFTFGQHKLRQQVQAAPYVENRRWTVGRVTYATLNVQGSCNNLCDVAPDPAEYAARNQADIAWLRQTFAQAKAHGSAAVMLVFQADAGFDLSDATRAPVRDPKTLAQTDASPTATRTSCPRCATRPSPSAGRSRPSIATRITSASTSRSSTPTVSGWRTSRAWRPSATTRRTGTTTSIGSRWTSIRAAARCSPTRSRSCRPTAPRCRRHRGPR